MALTEKGEMPADIIIGADGANSTVRKIINPDATIKFYSGAQVRLKASGIKEHAIKVYIKKPFFAWIIPESSQVVRVGVIGSNPHHELTVFLKEVCLEGEPIEKFGGVLPLGSCCTQKDNIALVGDSACQVKPLSHGGIYYGLLCAEILADCITRGRLAEYEKHWLGKFGREIEVGLKMKRLYEELEG